MPKASSLSTRTKVPSEGTAAMAAALSVTYWAKSAGSALVAVSLSRVT